MKTSFYFFLWIIIYPLLGLFHNAWIDQNSFLVALFVVWLLSWILNRNMPETLQYERTTEVMTVMEEVFSGKVKAFMKRLSRIVTVDFISSVYLGVAFVFVLFSMVRGSADDWIALLIFGFFAFATLSRAFQLNKSYQRIKAQPTKEECISVLENIYRVNYTSYYNSRIQASAESLLPPQPKFYKAFQIFSLVIAILCGLFGIYYLVMSIIILAIKSGPEAISGGIMYFLYGSLATYFGIKDSVSGIQYLRKK